MITEATTLKIIGIAASAVGTGATLVGGWVNEKKMNQKIEAEVAKAIAKVTK